MTTSLPRPVLWLGLAGLLPFLGLTLASLVLDPPAAALAARALLAYGAVILSFLGAVHWGLALAEGPEAPGLAMRFGLGVLPSLIGWVALLLPTVPGSILLGLGLALTLGTETLAARRGMLPETYLRLRWGLTLLVFLCLVVTVSNISQ